MKMFTKDSLIKELKKIKKAGWLLNSRQGNSGAIGNILEDLLGIKENNLPIPNASEWELKTHRKKSSALITLFHMEPSPRALNLVPQILLKNYGWQHAGAGKKYNNDELSFRQTIGTSRSDRGFCVKLNHEEKKILVSFDAKYVSDSHKHWLNSVKNRVGLKELNPMPYWGFDDVFHKAGTKLLNCFYILADVKTQDGTEYFHYTDIFILQKFSLSKFLLAIENNDVVIDFDARTGHNHGTKFRLRSNKLPELYESVIEI